MNDSYNWKPLQNKRLIACGACACRPIPGPGGAGGIGNGEGTNTVNGYGATLPGGAAGTLTAAGVAFRPGVNAPGSIVSVNGPAWPPGPVTVQQYWYPGSNGPVPAQSPSPVRTQYQAVMLDYQFTGGYTQAWFGGAGNGGALGSAGEDGALGYNYWQFQQDPVPRWFQDMTYGGAGGSAGAAIAGNSYVSWLANGTKTGAVT